MTSQIETQLQRALVSHADSGEPLDVVLRFAVPKLSDADSQAPLVQRRADLAKQTSAQIQEVLDRTGRAVGQDPAQVSMFPAVGSAYVQAHPAYLKVLLDQEEVLGATLNSSKAPYTAGGRALWRVVTP